jgi:RNA polymerase sigma-70 factor (ECF subfamily)
LIIIQKVITQIDIHTITRQEFEEIFRLHYANLCAYAYKYLQEKEASEELVQDVFFKLWVKRTEIDIQSSLKSYLYRAVRNGALNVISHLKIREEYKASNEQNRLDTEMQDGDELVGSELNQCIQSSLMKMPEQRRRIFVMSRYEDLKYREIAEQLGVSIKTVESQMTKALKFLRVELREYLPLISLFFINFFNNDIG